MTAIFVKPLVTHGPPDGNWPNRPVNLSLVTYVIKAFSEKPWQMRSKTDRPVPKLQFCSTDVNWWFSSEEERDQEYDRIMERFAA